MPFSHRVPRAGRTNLLILNHMLDSYKSRCRRAGACRICQISDKVSHCVDALSEVLIRWWGSKGWKRNLVRHCRAADDVF